MGIELFTAGLSLSDFLLLAFGGVVMLFVALIIAIISLGDLGSYHED